MLKFIKRVSKKAGLPPGTLVHVGEKRLGKTRIRVMDYDETACEERELDHINDLLQYKEKQTITWINIDGLHEIDTIERIGNLFGLHSLILEDILHTGQRPKMDDYEGYVFIISQMLSYNDQDGQVQSEQVSLVLGPGYVISFQEKGGDVFDPIRERLRKGKGRIRKMGADYLVYTLIDAIVDNYFIVLEKVADEVEGLEEDLLSDSRPELLQKIHVLKRELIFLRKSVWPLREIITRLERGESDLIQDKTTVYLRDVYDHTIQVVETIETFRDIVSGMLDVYLSSMSNRMNEVMKVLTIIATLFIPLTFIAGVYGMNFKYMPEIEWPWGYPLIWSVMIALALVMIFYFRHKRWF